MAFIFICQALFCYSFICGQAPKITFIKMDSWVFFAFFISGCGTALDEICVFKSESLTFLVFLQNNLQDYLSISLVSISHHGRRVDLEGGSQVHWDKGR